MGLAVSCVPATPTSESLNSTIVVTKQAPHAEFHAFKTFFLRPEIREFTSTGSDTVLDESDAKVLLKETTDQLTSRGYTEADSKDTADLAVEMGYISSVGTVTTCYSWWDSYYWGYPYYPYYPYYGDCTVSTWKAHTLVTVIVDLSALPQPPKSDGGVPPDVGIVGKVLAGIWFSGVYGVTFDSNSNGLQKAVDGIDQAFTQSPYLQSSQ
jgi:hypothetical protein